MTYCIGECKKYKALKPTEIGRYATGQKRYNYCEVFVEYEGFHMWLDAEQNSSEGKRKVYGTNCKINHA